MNENVYFLSKETPLLRVDVFHLSEVIDFCSVEKTIQFMCVCGLGINVNSVS